MLTHFIQFFNRLQKFLWKKKLLFCIRSKVIHVFVTALLPLALDEHVLKRALSHCVNEILWMIILIRKIPRRWKGPWYKIYCTRYQINFAESEDWENFISGFQLIGKPFFTSRSKYIVIILADIAKSQSKYLGKLKDTVGEGEFIVTEYFSENYTIHTKYNTFF